MKAPAVYALMVTAAAFALWHPTLRRSPALPGWVGMLFRSGHAFLPLGLILGLALSGSSETSATLLADLWPLVAFVAGWVGYAVGIRGDWHHLSALGAGGLARSVAPSVLAATLTTTIGYGVMLAMGVAAEMALPFALVLGAAGACSGAGIFARLADAAGSDDDRARFRRLATAARADDIVVCALALVAFAALPAVPGAPPLALALVLPLLGGVALGVVAWLLLGSTTAPDERLLLGIAVLGIGAGMGAWIEVSPAVVCAVMAATLATLPGGRAQTLREPIAKLGRPAIVILMMATGLAIAPHLSLAMALGGVGLVAVRWAAFAAAGRLERDHLGSDAALLAAPGQLGVVIAFTFYHLVGGALAADLLGAVALAAFADQLRVSHRATRRVNAAVEAPCGEV